MTRAVSAFLVLAALTVAALMALTVHDLDSYDDLMKEIEG